MEKQLFVVTLEVPPPFSNRFPRVDAERMANIIRDAVQDKSCSFTGPVPFTITVERADTAALSRGEMREYSPEEFGELPQETGASHSTEKETSIVR